MNRAYLLKSVEYQYKLYRYRILLFCSVKFLFKIKSINLIKKPVNLKLSFCSILNLFLLKPYLV